MHDAQEVRDDIREICARLDALEAKVLEPAAPAEEPAAAPAEEPAAAPAEDPAAAPAEEPAAE